MKLRFVIAALTLPLLSGGCAAALLPLAAAGAMATQQGGGEKEARPMTASAAIPPAARQSEAAELTRGEAVALAELGESRGSDTYEILELTELPAPSGAPESAAPAAYKSYSGFTNYVMDQTQVDLSEGSRTSAILKDPARLDGEVQECYGQPAAVLIDIDPPGDIFDATARTFIDPGLREALRELSANSVQVLWISDLSPNFSDEVVTAIKRAGFAEVTEDSLLLGAGEDGRKQALREQAAMRFCIVAIAGDEKGDFDEAYFYLRDPVAAIGLDRLYDKGWFLAPTPFITEGS
ncbi:hypothetical protein [Altererythrobacter sp. ZODW24]|uniref:hypothetical protein n=1 Tax=Altererythrobacter sp. ZODW24 TaxID=2185142 RepID=UPI000DF7E83A|nr:hypothetical protein [Altererythrobacter sp. ZODW24]